MRLFPIACLAALALAGCGGTTPAENRMAAADNAAGLGGDVVELPAGEGEGVPGVDVPEAAPTIADADPAATDRWVGRWTGVEGTYLDIAKGDAPGRYRLTMQYTLDDSGSFEGTGDGEGIAFTRPDGAQRLRASDGAATGLKYLDGKQDCLTVKTGEGYCRG